MALHSQAGNIIRLITFIKAIYNALMYIIYKFTFYSYEVNKSICRDTDSDPDVGCRSFASLLFALFHCFFVYSFLFFFIFVIFYLFPSLFVSFLFYFISLSILSLPSFPLRSFYFFFFTFLLSTPFSYFCLCFLHTVLTVPWLKLALISFQSRHCISGYSMRVFKYRKFDNTLNTTKFHFV